MKTEIVEIRKPGGTYDGNCTIVRNVSDEMVFFINSGSIRMKDGRLTTSGNIYCDGVGIGSSVMGAVIRFVNPNIVIESPMRFNANLYLGWDGNSYELELLDPDGNFSVKLDGTSGHGFFKGGLNVGSATGAGPGEIRLPTHKFIGLPGASNSRLIFREGGGYDIAYFLDTPIICLNYFTNAIAGLIANMNVHIINGLDIILYSDAHQTITGRWDAASGDLTGERHGTFKGGINAGTATGATTGQIKASGSIEATGQNILGQTHQLEANTSSLPTPSAAYRGQFYLKSDAGEADQDKLYICLRSAEASGYTWVMVAQGFEP